MKRFRWQIAQFFENFWWKRYLKNRSSSEYLAWKKDYWTTFLNDISLSQTAVQEPIIDIGCGPAGIFLLFEGKEITALDPLLTQYEELAIFKKKAYTSVDFANERFEDFTAAKKYKTIFCLNAINHFVDIDFSFNKLREICDNQGELVLSVDAHNFSFFRKLFALIPFDILHPHQYNLAEYEHFLEKSGFSIDRKVVLKKEFFFDYWVLVAKPTH